MKIFNYIISGIFSFSGTLFIVMGPDLPLHEETPVKPISMGIVFIVWSVLLIEYTSKSYKGGAASIIGAILIGVGVYTSTEVLYFSESLTNIEIYTHYIVYLFFYVAGAALMIQGHRIHERQSSI